jgi:hypothetical protein
MISSDLVIRTVGPLSERPALFYLDFINLFLIPLRLPGRHECAVAPRAVHCRLEPKRSY